MYTKVRARVRSNNNIKSNEFDCPTGLKEGCLCSPILFVFFVNEFVKQIENSELKGIQLFPDWREILCLLFADDLALMANTVVGLQRILNKLSDFTFINTKKTKVMVYKNGGTLSKTEKWYFNKERLEVVNGFPYVGVFLSQQLSFPRMANEQATAGKRSSYGYLRT
ncbi:hypothetical protein MAR_025218, partial [Mya arenaria]